MKNENSQQPLIINIKENGIEINDQYLQFPLTFSDLKNQFGDYYELWGETDTNMIYMWNDLGIKAFVPKNEGETFTLTIKTADINKDFLPKKKFDGDLKINNQPFTEFFAITESDRSFKDMEIENVKFSSWLSEDEFKNIEEVSISQKVNKKRTIIKTDKYKPNKISGKKIEFTDLNFKLAIIEELMYIKELIQPRFDIFEFTDSYEEREIDVESEGYEPIPEAIEYFKDLEIDKKFATEITEIYQDGGNDIYMNITPYWDGEDDYFNIEAYDDIKHFPNLKKMTLFSNDDKVYEELKLKGIDAVPL
ncbi:hypothetical protein OF897_20415 [Chryseobacterium formosus]|uniref:Uncharacterized protein n=1 Tax=Chryseobacterium formosus TaxID=1537363 RepID=A0ABT3XXA9_9FLAO|nr:hypothetical protein [Chryseobacterium formosus]MCX8526285.1 hypothetical protein [Chryseobacterium formosus]